MLMQAHIKVMGLIMHWRMQTCVGICRNQQQYSVLGIG
jgi:hypothetical protein